MYTNSNGIQRRGLTPRRGRAVKTPVGRKWKNFMLQANFSACRFLSLAGVWHEAPRNRKDMLFARIREGHVTGSSFRSCTIIAPASSACLLILTR